MEEGKQPGDSYSAHSASCFVGRIEGWYRIIGWQLYQLHLLCNKNIPKLHGCPNSLFPRATEELFVLNLVGPFFQATWIARLGCVWNLCIVLLIIYLQEVSEQDGVWPPGITVTFNQVSPTILQ